MKPKLKKSKLIVLGIIGPIASGKGAAANWLVESFGFKKISLSNFLRQEARKRGKVPNRKYLRKLQNELRAKYGNDFLLQKAIEIIKKRKYEKIVIDGLRQPDECILAKKLLKAKIILTDSNPFIRFKRARKRGRKGFASSYEQFLQQDAIENALFDFHKTKKLADYKINNSGDIKILYKEINKLARKLGIKK